MKLGVTSIESLIEEIKQYLDSTLTIAGIVIHDSTGVIRISQLKDLPSAATVSIISKKCKNFILLGPVQ